MIDKCLDNLPVNPIPTLEDWQDEALRYFITRDLLGSYAGPVNTLWDLPEPSNLVKKQLEDGSWKYPGKTYDPDSGENYFLLQTFRNLRVLVDKYGFTTAHPGLLKAAEYLFGCQTSDGDIRGIIGNQYMPYYHGVILELLIKAGYVDDSRVLRGLDWLLSMRQDDGGWIVPAQAVPSRMRTPEFWHGEPVLPERSKPHAHIATGMVLRAFSSHPDYRQKTDVIRAGEALKSRFFKPDTFNDRKAKSYWFKFQYPFWWSSLLTALDTLSKMGFDLHDPDIARGLAWFKENQEEDGLWPTGYGSGKKAEDNRRWVGLAICRVLKTFL